MKGCAGRVAQCPKGGRGRRKPQKEEKRERALRIWEKRGAQTQNEKGAKGEKSHAIAAVQQTGD